MIICRCCLLSSLSFLYLITCVHTEHSHEYESVLILIVLVYFKLIDVITLASSIQHLVMVMAGNRFNHIY
ncbi:hypothetical protein DERF_006618 [Dermatophagoides farinae]|uniref:Secreted protein n=1 Tax=Dermatophagoides farinae TaxID=6954 RepID=A0A922HW94_DERFA|nr:hypothetical protein DERF_006618 [Dermatophagoides farinae]